MTPIQTSFDWSLASFDPSLVADELLASLDIAEVNLACARDLPGSEDLDVPACLGKIDEWTEKVRAATSRNYDRFIREPKLFDRSLGKFYMTVLCATLQRECGVRYNPVRANDPGDARDSADRFIHGITHGAGGTCASLPVLYAAVGRRLGYPLKVVFGARHLFLRWDESDAESSLARDRFNIEATANGFVSHPDRFYEHWPFPHPDPDIDARYYLRSLTPREELASFLCIRSIVLMDNGKFVQAIQPAGWARQLAPDDYSIKVHLEITMLLALGILGEKPAWMDEHPVVRPDGVTWSRYWWPRPMENRELLPVTRLPRHVLAEILPRAGQEPEFGDLADALYERAGQYADEAYVTKIQQAALAANNAAEVSFHNALTRARWKAFVEETSQSNRDDLARRNAALAGTPFGHPMRGVEGPSLPPHAHPPFGPLPMPTSMPAVPGITRPIPLGGHAPMMGHHPFGMPRFGPFAAAIADMPTPPHAGQSGAHALLSLAARRPPFPIGATAPPHCPPLS